MAPMEKALPRQNDQKTVLVVDDDPYILNSVSTMLLDSNYKVLRASSGAEALEQSKDYKQEIHLLLSDFQMAGMSGVDLATRITGDRPNLKVLLMSGFTEGMLVLNEGWHFLAKPFIPSQLRALIVGLVSPDRTSKFSEPSAKPRVNLRAAERIMSRRQTKRRRPAAVDSTAPPSGHSSRSA
jgi:DNA-binding NtrC family response regulator